jgi:hypothetical protein
VRIKWTSVSGGLGRGREWCQVWLLIVIPTLNQQEAGHLARPLLLRERITHRVTAHLYRCMFPSKGQMTTKKLQRLEYGVYLSLSIKRLRLGVGPLEHLQEFSWEPGGRASWLQKARWPISQPKQVDLCQPPVEQLLTIWVGHFMDPKTTVRGFIVQLR